MSKFYSYYNFVILALTAVILSASSSDCGRTEQKYHTNPNTYIVDRLANKRIIMLADYQHYYPLPLKSLTSLLEEWVEKVKSGESNDYEIVLTLELDSEDISVIKQFLASGDWEPLTNYFLPNFSTEWLEFIADLKEINNKIKNLNERPGFPKINFDLFGGEEDNILEKISIGRQ